MLGKGLGLLVKETVKRMMMEFGLGWLLGSVSGLEKGWEGLG